MYTMIRKKVVAVSMGFSNMIKKSFLYLLDIVKVSSPQTVVYKKGSEFPQKFLIYQLGGGYEMINLM